MRPPLQLRWTSLAHSSQKLAEKSSKGKVIFLTDALVHPFAAHN